MQVLKALWKMLHSQGASFPSMHKCMLKYVLSKLLPDHTPQCVSVQQGQSFGFQPTGRCNLQWKMKTDGPL